jgi:hypothetical protein
MENNKINDADISSSLSWILPITFLLAAIAMFLFFALRKKKEKEKKQKVKKSEEGLVENPLMNSSKGKLVDAIRTKKTQTPLFVKRTSSASGSDSENTFQIMTNPTFENIDIQTLNTNTPSQSKRILLPGQYESTTDLLMNTPNTKGETMLFDDSANVNSQYKFYNLNRLSFQKYGIRRPSVESKDGRVKFGATRPKGPVKNKIEFAAVKINTTDK